MLLEKEFLEVFRNLELKGELRALLEEVVVTKVAINQRKDQAPDLYPQQAVDS